MVEVLGAEINPDDPLESPPGVWEGAGRGGIGGSVVGGGPACSGRQDLGAGRFGRRGGSGAPHLIRPTGRPAWWDSVSHVVTPPICLDHLSSVGPPGSRNTVVQRNLSGPTARKWSKQESAAMNPPAAPRPADAPAPPPTE